MTKPHLISVDELRAAGALDVPPEWRKSLSVERKHYPLFGDDDEDDVVNASDVADDDDDDDGYDTDSEE
jgi:hypothetical protein